MYRLSCTLLLAVLMLPDSPGRAQQKSPVADPSAVVTVGDVRFTLLTPQLIRMEWSPGGSFEDHASLVFVNRRLPVPSFNSKDDGDWRVISTEFLRLRYKRGSGKFAADNLEVRFLMNGNDVLWHPGMEDKGNLGGTSRTLDGAKGAIPLEAGLLSRDGWVVVDDSQRPLYDNSDWPWVMSRPSGERQDRYFFGYGHNYRQELFDFTQVAGKIPMPPRFAFGAWWSRYWAYTDTELKQLVNEFHTYDVPLDVLVVDMDWHLTFNMRWAKQVLDQAGQRLGWTGYTWDKNYFPDPPGFLAWAESNGLKTPLNLHPASGIQPHEEHYPEMARAMGIDPATQKYVPFDIVDKKFASNYLKLIIGPLEKQGVDFWWLDWQQWGTTTITGVTPTWWLNYVFFTDMERRNKDRPLLFHRWGGLGNHRYEIGFSGDVITAWESLAFQPYFTATASNVGFGYWSHDIGGHIPGAVSPEMYTRWIQFGAFSPILRTHTTKNGEGERRIWAYPTEYFLTMRDAFLLRYALMPYIYSASREAYDTGVSLCRPMYYDYPEAAEAYVYKDQYMFGDALLVAPIATPVSADSLLAPKSIWLPEGNWFELPTGAMLRGPAKVLRAFAIDEIPVYAKAGSIIPMQPKTSNTREKLVDPLILTVIPGDSGHTGVYEDEGNSLGYQQGKYAWTRARQKNISSEEVSIEISPVEGTYPGILRERSYELRLPGTLPPRRATCNGESIGWKYDGDKLTTIVSIPKTRCDRQVDVSVQFSRQDGMDTALVNGMPGKLSRLRRVMSMINNLWPKEWSPEIAVKASQTGNRMTIDPEHAGSELAGFGKLFEGAVDSLKALDIDASVKSRALHHLQAR